LFNPSLEHLLPTCGRCLSITYGTYSLHNRSIVAQFVDRKIVQLTARSIDSTD